MMKLKHHYEEFYKSMLPELLKGTDHKLKSIVSHLKSEIDKLIASEREAPEKPSLPRCHKPSINPEHEEDYVETDEDKEAKA
jgi:hypothetical protein